MSHSPSQHLSEGRGFYKEGEGKQKKEIRGRSCRHAGSVLTSPDVGFHGSCL